MSEKVCLNGMTVDGGKAVVSVLDYGLLYGYGLFETMRAYSGVVFRLEDHMERLMRSAMEVGIGIQGLQAEMEGSIPKTLKANGRSDAYVRLTVTYGIGKPRLNLGGKSRPNYFIITDDVPDFTSQYEKGVRICVAECVKQSGRSFTPRMKTLNYVDRALAKKEALERGFYDALILDETGFVAEATTSNVFMVEGGKLVTSSSESVLRGITRKTVLELAGDAGLEVEEEDLSLERLMESSEVFMTNSISEIMPVIQVNDSTIGGGRPGKATRIIHEKYEKKVGEYVKGRIYRR